MEKQLEHREYITEWSHSHKRYAEKHRERCYMPKLAQSEYVGNGRGLYEWVYMIMYIYSVYYHCVCRWVFVSIFVVWFSEGLLPSVCGAFYVSNFYALSGLICVYRLYGSVHVFSLVFLFIFYTVFFIISMCFVMWFYRWTQCIYSCS